MGEDIRWLIDVALTIVGIAVGFCIKTIQIKHYNKKKTNHSINVKGSNNTVAGRDINNGTKN